jgi:hypothetical protein
MTTTTTATITYTCTHCDSTDVYHDAWARWCSTKQAFELHRTFDNAYCNTCEATFRYLAPTPLPAEVIQNFKPFDPFLEDE